MGFNSAFKGLITTDQVDGGTDANFINDVLRNICHCRRLPMFTIFV